MISDMKIKKSNYIIVHGSPRGPEFWTPIGHGRRWSTWLKAELEKRGFEVFTPSMPVPWQPVYKDWKEEFEKLPIHESTILIGHSAGGAFLPRWLAEKHQKVKKLILIAPGKKIGDYPNAEHNRELYDFEIDPKIKNFVDDIVIFTSPEEPPHRQENIALYKRLLGARVISLVGRGHYKYDDMGTNEFPELLKEVLS